MKIYADLTGNCKKQGIKSPCVNNVRKQKDRLEKAMPDILEGYCSKSDKPREIAEQEAKAFLQIIEDSSNYQFGYNHSTGYSMIGYVCAYLRYYHPVEFVTAYLNNANNDDDLSMGTQLAKDMNITISPVKFRHAQAEYSCNAKDRIIYKGLASIKFLNDTIADELYQLRDNEYDTFIGLLYDIKNTTVNSRQLDILIKVGFFDEFGDRNQLLFITKMFNMFGESKQISKKKLAENNIDESLIRPFGNETKSMYNKLNANSFLNNLVMNIVPPQTSLKQKLDYENQAIGVPTTILPEYDKHKYFISDIVANKSITTIKLYEIYSGMIREVKIWNSSFNKAPIMVGEIISIYRIEKKNKREFTGKTDENGKRIYTVNPDKFEYWLSKYRIERGENDPVQI